MQDWASKLVNRMREEGKYHNSHDPVLAVVTSEDPLKIMINNVEIDSAFIKCADYLTKDYKMQVAFNNLTGQASTLTGQISFSGDTGAIDIQNLNYNLIGEVKFNGLKKNDLVFVNILNNGQLFIINSRVV